MNEYMKLFEKAEDCDEARYIYFCNCKGKTEKEHKKLREAYRTVSNKLFREKMNRMIEIYGI